MLHKRHAFVLMAALGAAMSVGGTAMAAPDPIALGDGPLTLKHRITHQENQFDHLDAARDFMDKVEDRDSWGLKHVVDAEIAAAANPGAGYAEGEAQTMTAADLGAVVSQSDGDDSAELLPGGEPEAAAAGTEGSADAAEVAEVAEAPADDAAGDAAADDDA